MNLFDAQRPTPIHYAISFVLLIVGLGWGVPTILRISAPPNASSPGREPDGLAKIRIEGANYRKDAFGTIMVATFTIQNDNDYPIKDVTVMCAHGAPSGTLIDSNTRTIYEKVNARGYAYIRDFNMGFVAAQATTSACRATGFVKL